MENFDSIENSIPTGSTPNAKLFSVLSYLNLFWLLGLLVEPEKNDPLVKSHVNCGITLDIINAVSAVIIFIPILGYLAFFATTIFIIVCRVIGFIKALSSETFNIPIIGDKIKIIR